MNTHVFRNVWVWIQHIIIEIVYYDKVLYLLYDVENNLFKVIFKSYNRYFNIVQI